MSKVDDRHRLARMMAARHYLRMTGMLTDSENEKIFKKICAYQDKNRVEISQARVDKAIQGIHKI